MAKHNSRIFLIMVFGIVFIALFQSQEARSGDGHVVIASGSGPMAPRQPQAAVGDDGSVHIVYGIEDAVYYAQSLSGGDTYDKPRLAFRVSNMSLGMRRGPRIVKNQAAILVTAIGGLMGKGRDGDIVAWRSTDDGRTWQGPVRVNDTADSAREGLHAMANGVDGSVWCVWLDLRDKHSEIYAAVSKDNGATWEPNRCVYRSPDGNVCECCHPSVAIDGQNVHVMFRNSISGHRDMYIASSFDGGRSFSEAKRLGHGTWALDACPMDGGMLTIGSDGGINTVWRRDGCIFHSTGAGSAETLIAAGQQPWIAQTKSGSVIAWTVGRDGDLLIKQSPDSDYVRLAQDARDPVVASASNRRGPVIVCWESKDGNLNLVKVAQLPAKD